MKRLSIKLRVTLALALFMGVMAALALAALLALSGGVLRADAGRQLLRVLEENADEVEFDDGRLEFDGDFSFYAGGVYTLVYDAGGLLLKGSASAPPDAGPDRLPLSEGPLRTLDTPDGPCYISDLRIPLKRYGDIWLRGVLPTDGASGAVNALVRAAFIALPLWVVLASLGCYLLIRRSFRPFSRMAQTASAISEGADLSRRIALGPGGDELHRLSDAFDRMLGRLEASFDAERQFTSDASHELRTPVSVVLAQCEYALEKERSGDEYVRALEAIQRQGYRMSRLIAQLLAFTRLEQHAQSLCFEDTDLTALTLSLCEENALLAQQDISLSWQLNPGVRAPVERALYARLFNNLVGNAYRYGRPGGIIRVTLAQDARSTRLSVCDDGIGIAPEEQEKIFRRFYQADAARSGGAGGMGMGLAIVQKIAQLHGGCVRVCSAPDQGSDFTFEWPMPRK